MTPDRRLDQLEPLMADSLQKIDRLIEGQGKLAEGQSQLAEGQNQLAEGQNQLAEGQNQLTDGQSHILTIAIRADQKADITAKGVAELTLSTQRQYEELKAGQEELKASQEELKASQEELKAGQEAIMQYLREKLP